MARTCIECGVILSNRYKIKYCSNKCQHKHQRSIFINKWLKGDVDGVMGISVKAISGHIKSYLREINGEKCSECGWNKRHSVTGKVPLDVDHIDGNSENNKEYNLRLLCPNCHSLTVFYKNLNRGKGRKWRMNKYIREVSKTK